VKQDESKRSLQQIRDWSEIVIEYFRGQ
jgi:hypothetical protein